MRLAPVAIRHWRDPAALRDLAARQSRVTHAAPEAVSASVAYAEPLARAIAGQRLDRVLRAKGLQGAGAIGTIPAGAWRGKPRDAIRSGGYVAEGLDAALWSVARTGSFRQAALTAAISAAMRTPRRPLPASLRVPPKASPPSRRTGSAGSPGATASSTRRAACWNSRDRRAGAGRAQLAMTGRGRMNETHFQAFVGLAGDRPAQGPVGRVPRRWAGHVLQAGGVPCNLPACRLSRDEVQAFCYNNQLRRTVLPDHHGLGRDECSPRAVGLERPSGMAADRRRHAGRQSVRAGGLRMLPSITG